MNMSLILRRPPIEGDKDHEALYKLMPRFIIYSMDFGVAKQFSPGFTEEDDKRRKELIERQIAETKSIIPFNGASEISPLIPSYVFNHGLDKQFAIRIAIESMKYFPASTIYVDLGITPDTKKVRAIVEGLWQVSPNCEIGLIAPAHNFLSSTDLYEICGLDENIKAAPFLGVSQLLKEQLDQLTSVLGEDIHVFCASVPEEEKRNFNNLVDESGVEKFVFWSANATEGIALLAQELPVVESANDVLIGTVKMKALNSTVARTGRSISSQFVAGILADSIVDVHRYAPDVNGNVFGKIMLPRPSYVAIEYGGKANFVMIEETIQNHEQQKE